MNDALERLRQAERRFYPPEPAFERLLRRRAAKRRGQRVMVLTVSAVTAGAVILGLIALGGLAGRDTGRPGDGVRTDPRLILGPDEYFYLKVESSIAADGHERDEETWWRVDGSGEVRNRGTRQDKYPLLPSGVYGPGAFPTEVDTSKLSTDPDVLREQLLERSYDAGFRSESDGLWAYVRFLLMEEQSAPPVLRAALFVVASELDGVSVAQDTHDLAGRSAIGLRFTYSDIEQWMYFDPTYHQLMMLTSSYRDNTPAWVVLDSGIVRSKGVRPEGDQWLFPPTPEDLVLPQASFEPGDCGPDPGQTACW